MMRFKLTFFLVLLTPFCFAQKTITFPKLRTQGSTVNEFIPEHWHVLDETSGDLNGDESKDVAMVLEYERPVDEVRAYGDNSSSIIKETQKPRMLVILFKNPGNGTYQLSTQNNDFILRSEEGGKLGDPLQQMAIKDQLLYLRFKGGGEWRWEMGYTFKFERKDWQLTSAINLYYNSNSGDMTERIFDFKERSLLTTNGNLYRRDIANSRTSDILFFGEKRTLKTFKKPWAWEILPDVYL